MRAMYSLVLAVPFTVVALVSAAVGPSAAGLESHPPAKVRPMPAHAPLFADIPALTGQPATQREARLIDEGRQMFRYDTFGDEQLWTDDLRMHEVIATVPPATALSVG